MMIITIEFTRELEHILLWVIKKINQQKFATWIRREMYITLEGYYHQTTT